MALELFKPFVISQILKKELAFNIRGATRLIDDSIPEVWAILEDIIKDKFVLLNRAPTLHRLGIQAFRPILIEGNAIQVHPLVCTAFNADFDGDQMAVHVPLSVEAQMEAREIMASDKNILKPGNGEPTVIAKMLDIVLGCYWMTKAVEGEKGEGKIFPSPNNAITAYDFDEVGFRAPIKVLGTDSIKYREYTGKLMETTVGRMLFNSVLPSDYPFINHEIDRKKMASLVDELIEKYGVENLPPILDKIKNFGFKYTTHSGITWGIDDVKIPEGKAAIIVKAKKQAEEVKAQFNAGLLSEEERLRKNTEVWHAAKGEVEKLVPEALDKNGSALYMLKSGARGSVSQLTQMAGMKGLITNTAGETIEFPIISCAKEGLSPLEYFITTHGSRKGLTDTALMTAKAGYLTRRLFDVAQDAIVTAEDCGTKEYIVITTANSSGLDLSLAKNIRGRFLAEDILDEKGEVLFKKGHLVSKRDAQSIETKGVKSISVRSPLTCKTARGVCVQCYGADLGKHRVVDIGEAVGTVAAQAIGEPGTQLTMRTFHAGGTASVGGDITLGLPRVEEVFENRTPKNPATVSHVDGSVSEIKKDGSEKTIIILPDEKSKTKDKIEYPVPSTRMILVKVGDHVNKGDLLTDGSADIDELFKYAGKEAAQNYIIREITKPYELQGETVSRKHIEIIVRQMFSRKKIKDAGGTTVSKGDVADQFELEEVNQISRDAGHEEAKADGVLMGITEVSLSRKSFLSAASFQHTTRVLIAAAIRGTDDKLVGLKENVIIGRLIPAGTGFKGSEKYEMIERLHRGEDVNGK
jgi:DNA-directed RNA polymerase subunit beta'